MDKAYKIIARNPNDPCAPWKHLVASTGHEMELMVRDLLAEGWKVHVREAN